MLQAGFKTTRVSSGPPVQTEVQINFSSTYFSSEKGKWIRIIDECNFKYQIPFPRFSFSFLVLVFFMDLANMTNKFVEIAKSQGYKRNC